MVTIEIKYRDLSITTSSYKVIKLNAKPKAIIFFYLGWMYVQWSAYITNLQLDVNMYTSVKPPIKSRYRILSALPVALSCSHTFSSDPAKCPNFSHLSLVLLFLIFVSILYLEYQFMMLDIVEICSFKFSV